MHVPMILPRNLYFEDIGMLAWLKIWTAEGSYITESAIIDASPAQRERVRSSLKRLEAASLIERHRARDAKGRIAGIEFTITGKL